MIPADMQEARMETDKVLQMPLAKIYPLLVQKAERKGRTRGEVDEVISG